jgi:hypothetical protein
VHKNNDGFGICFIEMTEFKDWKPLLK